MQVMPEKPPADIKSILSKGSIVDENILKEVSEVQSAISFLGRIEIPCEGSREKKNCLGFDEIYKDVTV